MKHIALAFGLTLLAGCLPASSESETAVPPEEDSVEILSQNGALIYTATIFAPDPCYRVPEAADVTSDGQTVRVTRALLRDPGICATVLTPLTVMGDVPSGDEPQFALRLLDASGKPIFDAFADLAR